MAPLISKLHEPGFTVCSPSRLNRRPALFSRQIPSSPFFLPTTPMTQPKIIPFPSARPTGGAVDRPAMKSDLLEQASHVVPDIPVLINMVSQRVRQLNNGRPPLVRINQRVGQADIALMEIIQGKIVLVEGSAEERF